MKKRYIIILVILSISLVVCGFYISFKGFNEPVSKKEESHSEAPDINPSFDTSVSIKKIIAFKTPDGFENNGGGLDSFIHKIYIEESNMCEFEIYYQKEDYTSTLSKMKERDISYTEKDVMIDKLLWKEVENTTEIGINHYYFTKYQDGFVVYHFLQIKDCKNYEEEILNSIQFQK